MSQHKDIKMIVWHALRRRAPYTGGASIIFLYHLHPILLLSSISRFLMTAFKAFYTIHCARVKVSGEHIS